MDMYRRIADYIEKNGSITSLEAFREFNETRLSARIFTMKKKLGYPIYGIMHYSKLKMAEIHDIWSTGCLKKRYRDGREERKHSVLQELL